MEAIALPFWLMWSVVSNVFNGVCTLRRIESHSVFLSPHHQNLEQFLTRFLLQMSHVPWFVCLSVSVGTLVSPAKSAEPIEMLFREQTHLGCQRNRVLDGDARWRHMANTME